MRHCLGGTAAICAFLASSPVRAQPSDQARESGEMTPSPASEDEPARAGARIEVDGSAEGNVQARGRDRAPLSKRTDQPWIYRWAPEKTIQEEQRLWGMLELGPMLGVLFPSRAHELFEPDLDLDLQGFRPLQRAAFELGGRIGYFPMRFFGVEAEGAWMPSRTRDIDARVNLWGVRAHGVLQLGLWSITPFVVVGGGVLAVASPREALGSNIDQAFHVGVGAKAYINRWLAARIDLRNTVHPRQGISAGATNSPEVLLGLSFTLGRRRDRDVPAEARPGPALVLSDRDGDGIFDEDDACPDVPGVPPDGCPVEDRDGDGFPDDEDACPDVPGVEPDGCPPVEDRDGDGFPDDEDACPDEPGVEPDGCPDTIPEEVSRFEGTLDGVFFDVGKATLRPQSRTKLDEAADVLKRHPKLQVEISGHTDSTGSRDLNMDLSRNRAESVKAYLVEQGVAADRIRTRGAGPDEPIDSNATKDGRAKNRRIEFRVLDWLATE
jgi:outer membrane protein OmpA-like peptidoglycan-associated protein